MVTKDAIVVAVDGSDASLAAVRWAARTATQRRKPLHVVAFWEFLIRAAYAGAVRTALQNEADKNVASAYQLAAEVAPGLVVTHAVCRGLAAPGLIALSQDAALIFLGARGLGLVGGALLGSVSAAVLGHSVCPVVIVREDMPLDGPGSGGPVVVGVDGSDNSRQAAEVAFREADARGVGVLAVSSWLDDNAYASPAALQATSAHAEMLQREQLDMLEKAMRWLRRSYPDITLEQEVGQGRPADALARAAESAQLLVVGSHGRGGFMATVLGSTSRALLQKSPCPLMVVRPGA